MTKGLTIKLAVGCRWNVFFIVVTIIAIIQAIVIALYSLYRRILAAEWRGGSRNISHHTIAIVVLKRVTVFRISSLLYARLDDTGLFGFQGLPR